MFGRRRRPEDFAAELEAHLQLEIEELQKEGLSPGDAHAAARRRFGNVTHARERFYESSRWVWWDRFWQDVRYGARMLRKAPGLTAVAVLTMAVGIGATTAIFGIVDATLLHPLPYPHPEQLVAVEDDLPGVGSEDVGLSQPELQDLQHSGIFQYVSPAWFDEQNLTGASRPAKVSIDIVAPSYFALLGVSPRIGHSFDPSNHQAGFLPGVLISDGLWKRLFGADPRILDRSIRLDTDVYRIVGVMPPGFRPPGRTPEERNVEVWAATNFYGPPLAFQPPRAGRNIPGAIARMSEGLSIAEAQSKVDGLVAALRDEFPADYPSDAGWRIRLVPLKTTVVGDARQSLTLLFGAVALLLLIGSVNVANLQLARAGARTRELAVRQALGAARGRLVRQLLTENLLLALVAGAASVAVLLGAKRLLLRLVPDSVPTVNDVTVDSTVLLFAVGASIVTGVLFGLAPALHVNRLASRLNDAGRGSTAAGRLVRSRQILVVGEFALSLVLLAAAGLLVRSFQDLLNVPLGFTPGRVMSVRSRLPYPNDITTDRYRTVSQQAPFFHELLRRIRTLPGVQEVAIGSSTAVPLDHTQRDLNRLPVQFERRSHAPSDQPSWINGIVVTPEYFHLLGIPLRRGRLFTEFDTGQAPGVAVVDQAMADAYWPGEDPLGQHVKLGRTAPSWSTVVGVVADARTESLDERPVAHIYASLYQYEWGAKHLAIFVRGRFDRAALPDQVRQQVQAVDPTLPVFGAEMLTDAVSASLSDRRFSMEIVGLFALTALLLAALGVYGVTSFMVGERAREIGIRVALGAKPWVIVRSVLRQGLWMAGVGAAIGLLGALAAAHVMSAALYGVTPNDAPTFAGVAVLLVGVSLFACSLAARRAVRIDPLIVLRSE